MNMHGKLYFIYIYIQIYIYKDKKEFDFKFLSLDFLYQFYSTCKENLHQRAYTNTFETIYMKCDSPITTARAMNVTMIYCTI